MLMSIPNLKYLNKLLKIKNINKKQKEDMINLLIGEDKRIHNIANNIKICIQILESKTMFNIIISL